MTYHDAAAYPCRSEQQSPTVPDYESYKEALAGRKQTITPSPTEHSLALTNHHRRLLGKQRAVENEVTRHRDNLLVSRLRRATSSAFPTTSQQNRFKLERIKSHGELTVLPGSGRNVREDRDADLDISYHEALRALIQNQGQSHEQNVTVQQTGSGSLKLERAAIGSNNSSTIKSTDGRAIAALSFSTLFRRRNRNRRADAHIIQSPFASNTTGEDGSAAAASYTAWGPFEQVTDSPPAPSDCYQSGQVDTEAKRHRAAYFRHEMWKGVSETAAACSEYNSGESTT
jgi:hypothetical protein